MHWVPIGRIIVGVNKKPIVFTLSSNWVLTFLDINLYFECNVIVVLLKSTHLLYTTFDDHRNGATLCKFFKANYSESNLSSLALFQYVLLSWLDFPGTDIISARTSPRKRERTNITAYWYKNGARVSFVKCIHVRTVLMYTDGRHTNW